MNKTFAADNESRQQNQFSIRPGTINKELGLDLYVLLYWAYRGLRSVDDIYRQSAHTENYREPGVHCNKKRQQ